MAMHSSLGAAKNSPGKRKGFPNTTSFEERPSYAPHMTPLSQPSHPRYSTRGRRIQTPSRLRDFCLMCVLACEWTSFSTKPVYALLASFYFLSMVSLVSLLHFLGCTIYISMRVCFYRCKLIYVEKRINLRGAFKK